MSNIAGNTKTTTDAPAVLVRHAPPPVSAYNHLKFDSLKVVMDQRGGRAKCSDCRAALATAVGPICTSALSASGRDYPDQGADFPVQFEDKHHVAWRPMIGDALAPTASGYREEEWRWCAKCHGLYFSGNPHHRVGSKGPARPGGVTPTGEARTILLTVNSNVAGQKGLAPLC